MKLGDIMTKDVTAVSLDTSVYDAACIMRDRNVGSVPICTDDMNVEGIVTDRDIVLRVVCDDKDAHNVRCQDIMTDSLAVGKTEMDVEEAIDLMGDLQVRRLPVVENGRLAGFVSLGDVAVNTRYDRATEEALGQISTPSQPSM